MVISDKDLQSLANFMGYGDPDRARVFFMGIEEHNTFTDFDFVEYGKYTIKPNPKGTPTKGVTENMQCHIYRKLVAEVEEGEIFESGIHCFNYYPVGAKNVTTLPTGLERFGSKAKLYDYIEHETRRIHFLRAFIEEKILGPKKLLFVFGKESRTIAKRLLTDVKFSEPYEGWVTKNGKPSPIQWSEDKLIWLTGHPSHRWITSEVVEKIADIIVDKA